MLTDLFIRPDLDNSRVTATFTAPAGLTRVDYRILDGRRLVAEGQIPDVPSEGAVAFEVDLPGCKTWSVDDPSLYALKLGLHIDGRDRKVVRPFGMTKIHVADGRIHFNNEPFHMRAYIRGREAHDHPNLLDLATREYHEKHIRMAKAYGFNAVRFHSRVPDEPFLQAADRLGLLIHVEIRKYYGKYQKQRQSTGFDGDQTLVDQADWEKMILRLRNHPSVLVYCMGNEIDRPGNNERVKIIRGLTRKLDPTRLFLDTTSRGEYDRETADLDVQHMSYFAPFGKHHAMFDDSIHTAIYGSVTGKTMRCQDDPDRPAYVLRREVPIRLPLIAHEVCHYNVLRDPYTLREKFRRHGGAEPWWIGELIEMIHAKGHERQFHTMLKASTRFHRTSASLRTGMTKATPMARVICSLRASASACSGSSSSSWLTAPSATV